MVTLEMCDSCWTDRLVICLSRTSSSHHKCCQPGSTVANEWMNGSFYFRVIKNWLKASLVLHMRELKEDNGKLKQNAERYGVREGSPVEVQWEVRWIGLEGIYSVEDLWNRYVLSRNGRDRKWWMVWWWWQMMNEVDGMKQEVYSKDWVMRTRMSDLWFERGIWGWTSDNDDTAAFYFVYSIWLSLCAKQSFTQTIVIKLTVIWN